MSWARVDDGFHDHPKVDDLSLAAVGLWTLCLTWAHRHRKTAIIPGHVTEARVRKIAGKQAETLSAELVAARLWTPEPHIGGWEIHDFADYLPKERDPDERKQAGRKGAAKRWQGHSKQPSDDMASDSSRASAPASPSRPVPSPDVNALGGDRLEPLRAVADTDPPKCSAHPAGDFDGPCGGCKRVREYGDKNAEQAKRDALVAAANCPDCHGTNWREDDKGNPTRKCDHRRTA